MRRSPRRSSADPDRRVWHRAALMTGTHEELARELEEAGVRARRRGAIDVALTALGRAVQLSAPSHRAGRMFATAELAFERGRPDIAVAMLREIERLDLTPVEVARARWVSELLDARALVDDSRVADLIAIAERGRRGRRSRPAPQPALDRRCAHVVGEPGPGHSPAGCGRCRSCRTTHRRGSAAGLDPCVRPSVRQRVEGGRLPARGSR